MRIPIPKKILYPILAFLSTVLATAVLVYFAFQSQLRYASGLFNNLAEQQAGNLQEVLESDLHFIGTGANYFHSTKPENWDTFPVFAKTLLSSSDTLIGLQWMRRVEPHHLPKYTAEMREAFPDFTLFTVPKDGPKTFGYIMPHNEPIYVFSDIYPMSDANIGLLGFYSSRVRFQLVLDGIRATGQPSVSDKVRLLQDGLDRSLEKTGLLVYHPVFDQESQQNLIGVVVGVIRTTNYFKNLVTRTASGQDLLIKVTDMGFDAEDDPVLYQSEGWQETQGMEISKTVKLPNREWIVDFKLTERFTNNDLLVQRSVWIGGLVIACLFSYIVFLQVRGKERLSVLLDERTRELQFMVDHDALTGLLNRRAFNEELQARVMDDKLFALASFDIDNFKQVNDSFGHTTGDEMLVHIAREVEKHLRPDELFFRTGGDEFNIISNITDYKELYEHLNDIGRAVSSSHLSFGNLKVRSSLSIGGVVRTTENAEDTVQMADTQLYKSKKAGRNCVTVAE